MEGPTLADFIRSSREQILAEWDEFARTCTPAASSMSGAGLRDHAEQLLNWIAKDVETDQTPEAQEEKSKGNGGRNPRHVAAAQHGTQRFTDQFTLSQVFAEFRAIRATVVRMWDEAHPDKGAPGFAQITRFNEAIDQALAESVESFSAGIEESRDIFTAILGHDLRNPLGAIMMASMYLKNVSSPESDAGQMATSIYNSSLRMQALINDLLDVSRKHLGGDLPIEVSQVDLNEVCLEVIEEIAVANPGIDLTLKADGNPVAQLDRGRMAQVVSNLVANALQHGSRKKPITVFLHGKEKEIELVVHNRGKVIPPEAIQEIFEPTKRLDGGRAEAKQAGSLGLGLYIVNLVVESHGGRVKVTSSEEHGTAFTVHLPRNQSLTLPEHAFPDSKPLE